MVEGEEKQVEKDPEKQIKETELALKKTESIKSMLESKGIKSHFDAVGSPLTGLPSLLATAIIFSYYGHQKEVTTLVKALSKKG